MALFSQRKGYNPLTKAFQRGSVDGELRDLHQALRIKALETSRSISELINEAVKEALAEDAEDLAVFDERTDEPLISYEEMVKRLKKDGRI